MNPLCLNVDIWQIFSTIKYANERNKKALSSLKAVTSKPPDATTKTCCKDPALIGFIKSIAQMMQIRMTEVKKTKSFWRKMG